MPTRNDRKKISYPSFTHPYIQTVSGSIHTDRQSLVPSIHTDSLWLFIWFSILTGYIHYLKINHLQLYITQKLLKCTIIITLGSKARCAADCCQTRLEARTAFREKDNQHARNIETLEAREFRLDQRLARAHSQRASCRITWNKSGYGPLHVSRVILMPAL